MKHQQNKLDTTLNSSGLLPTSIKFISSCVKTVSSGVRSAGASVAASISSETSEDRKDKVLWACFDKLELGPSTFKNVLLLGYTNGFQVIDVDDASDISELVSKRDDPCTFMQIQPIPAKTEGIEGFRAAHPLLVVVAGDEIKGSELMLKWVDGSARDGFAEPQMENIVNSSTAVRFYSMRSHNYVHVLRFRSTVYMVRCSPRIIAVGLASQIYCIDALTLENKFSVLTYPVPQSRGHGTCGINVGYGPMDVGPRWLAYVSSIPMLMNTGCLTPQNLTPSPGISPSSSPGSGALMARYAMESSKQLAAGLVNLGDMGYKKLSKYCQELLPDGPSSPVSSHSGWKAARSAAHSTETENAGLVVIKDFVSGEFVSHLKAHTSPVSALCFDPSGMLLVTASVHGNNINIFRIMPSCPTNGSRSQTYNWTSSPAHLYKLHRGFTSAIIQDIRFSHYSQWVAVVSSKGTCHIYVISPFGEESGLQLHNYHVDGSTLAPVLSLPWWSSSSSLCAKNQDAVPATPPSPVTVSVVSRIRTGNSGWLNTVSSAASSAAGITSMTFSAVSAVFHCSIRFGSNIEGLREKALEHLLVYSPTGHVIQYELLPCLGNEVNEAASGSEAYMQDEELRVKSEAVQLWDVCRRIDWAEREESITGIALGRKSNSGLDADHTDSKWNDAGGTGLMQVQEQSRWYLSNAEVQMSYERTSVWANSKICFCTMDVAPNRLKFLEDSFGGEMEVEMIPDREVERKRKDLLPVFDHSPKAQSDWRSRISVRGRRSSLPEGKYSEDAFCFPEKPVTNKPVKISDFGLSDLVDPNRPDMTDYPPTLHTLVEKNRETASCISVPTSGTQNSVKNCNSAASSTGKSSVYTSSPNITHLVSSCPPRSCCIPAGAHPSPPDSGGGTSEASNVSSDRSDFSMNLANEGSSAEESDQDPLYFEKFLQEEYCKSYAPLVDECRDTGEALAEVGGGWGSPSNKEKPEEDLENDEMPGGVFTFAEED